jgi:hypothetical protein
MKEHASMASENKVLMRIFGSMKDINSRMDKIA